MDEGLLDSFPPESGEQSNSFSSAFLEVPNQSLTASLFRIGIATAGIVFLHAAGAIIAAAPLTQSSTMVVLLVFSSFFGLFLLATAGRTQIPISYRWLILFAFLWTLGIRASLVLQNNSGLDGVSIDPALYSDMASAILRHGGNPYQWDLAGSFDLYQTSQEASTPLFNGAIESHYPYPALAFLLVIPFQLLGMLGSFWLLLSAHATLLILLFICAPRWCQPIILLPVMAGFDFVAMTTIGVNDIVWILFLTVMTFVWHREWARAFLFGLAVAFKQSPWIIAPFLLIYIWHETPAKNRVRAMLIFVSGTTITFGIINAPFFFWDFSSWFAGVTSPLRGNLVFFSQGGLATLSHFDIFALPKNFYAIAVLAISGLLLFIYWRHFEHLQYTGWIIPGIILWFSYRNLVSYWTYWLFPALAALLFMPKISKSKTARPSWSPTITLTTAVVGFLLLTAVSLHQPATNTITIQSVGPMQTRGGRVVQLEVDIDNHSEDPIAPRFAIQHQSSTWNPLPWRILSGPQSLLPSENATYAIIADSLDRSLIPSDPAQLIISSATDKYSLRGSLILEPDRSFLWPTAIANPLFRYWPQGGDAPLAWQIGSDATAGGWISYYQLSDVPAIVLTLAESEGKQRQITLEQEIQFPYQPINVWVFVEPHLAESAKVAYGLAFAEAERELWVLFGSGNYAGPQPQNGESIYNVVPSGEWIFYEIDLPSIYRQLGWSPPPLQSVQFRGLDTDLRLITLKYLLASAQPTPLLQARFGPVVQTTDSNIPASLMGETLQDSAAYYLRLADRYASQRNYQRALVAYEQALSYAPEMQAAQEGLLQVQARLQELSDE